MKSDPLQAKYGTNGRIYIHAEIAAIKNALRTISVDDFKRATMIVVRTKCSDDNPQLIVSGMAKPCAGCMRAIAAFGIKDVFYSTNEGDLRRM